MREPVLVTGGAGYIGSHLVAALLERGHRVVVLDDLSRGTEAALTRAEQVGGGWIEREIGDVCDEDFVRGVFHRHPVQAVLHLAAFKSVEESVRDPASYDRVNAQGTRTLARAAVAAGVGRLVYASTAAVYGDAEAPLAEDDPIAPVSPYAAAKYLGEQELEAAFGHDRSLVHTRFFNVCGAHPSGQLGEFVDRPQNLVPVLLKAARDRAPVTVFGTDWPTPDGTCVRDYVHVVDIASGLLAALDATRRERGVRAYNLGTGRGASVLEVVAAVERAVGRPFTRQVGPRRAGDPARSVADPTRALRELGWVASHDLDAMAAHAWAWMTDGHG